MKTNSSTCLQPIFRLISGTRSAISTGSLSVLPPINHFGLPLFRKKHNLNVLTVKELFDFVVDPEIDEKDQEEALEKLNEKVSQRTEDERSAQEQIEAEVFKQIFIPRKLIEVDYPERDIAKAKSDQVIS